LRQRKGERERMSGKEIFARSLLLSFSLSLCVPLRVLCVSAVKKKANNDGAAFIGIFRIVGIVLGG
jgi:hypothetical protein